MEFDLKKTVDEVVNKIKGNDQLMEQFKKDPVKAIESATGIDLPDEKMTALVAAVKAKLGGGIGGDVLGKLGGLFGKKD